MSVTRSSPQRGLLAGLLALIIFASGAVAMTARSAGPVVQTPSARVRTGDRGGLSLVRGDRDGRGRGGGGGRGPLASARGAATGCPTPSASSPRSPSSRG